MLQSFIDGVTSIHSVNLVSSALLEIRVIRLFSCLGKYNRIPINFLIFNLATADIFFALFIAPKLIVSLYVKHPDGPASTVLCKLLAGGIFAWVSAMSSVCTLLAIAIERYYMVMYPHGDRWKLIKRKVTVCNRFEMQ